MELGATHIVNAKKDDPVEVAKSLTDGKGADYAVNASGIGATARTALECTGVFGALAVIGGGGEVSFHHLGSRVITGITEGQSITREFIPLLTRFYKEGRFPFDKLIQFYDFEDINTANDDSISGKTIKPILLMDK